MAECVRVVELSLIACGGNVSPAGFEFCGYCGVNFGGDGAGEALRFGHAKFLKAAWKDGGNYSVFECGAWIAFEGC